MGVSKIDFIVQTNIYMWYIRKKIGQFNLLSKGTKNIVLLWIPVHCGIQGSEKVDSLVQEATEKEYSIYKIPYTEF